MRSAAILVLLAALLVLQCAREGWSQLGTCDFDTACLQDYNDIEPQQYHLNNSERCPVVQNALQCLESFPCVDFALQLFKGHLRDLIAEFECQPAASPAPTPSASSAVQSTPSPTPVSCPSLPHTLPCDSPLGDCCPHLPPILPESCDMPILQDLGTPDLHPPPAPSDCSVSEDDRLTLQHCSMLTYSHLRPFGAYGLGIQLCSLPGSWYMVKHPGFSVEVSADSESVSCPHTLLRKVNVTFFNHSCSLGKSYVAESSTALPYSFSDGQASTPTLQLWVNDDRTSASILATWLNTSIVIRNYMQYLSVTVQVPGKFIFESQGLCNGGCPAHDLLDLDDSIGSLTDDCRDDNGRAPFHCAEAGALNVNPEVPYGPSCMLDVMKSNSLQVLDLLNATWKDALRLPNVGPVPSPDPPTPVTDPPATTDVSLPTDDPTIRTDSPTTDRTDYPTDIIDLTPSSQSPLYPSTHLLSVLVTLVAALLLR